MKINKVVTGMMTLLLSTVSLAGFASISEAVNEDTVINERWGKPTFVAGAGLSEAQRGETMNLLKVNADQVNIQTATGADLIHYLGSGSGDDASMLSSVVVTRENPGKGITVSILTPENITEITADQYKNPLITAGITDATVNVGSIVKVTGESALTGVYKAFEANGDVIDTDRAQLAQDELATTNQVANEITQQAASENSDLSAEEQAAAEEAYQTQLNQTLVDIKKDLAELKEKVGENVTAEEVTEIVNNALAKNDLSDYISQDSINQLVALAQRYASTDGVLSEESLAQLDKISDGFKNTLNGIGDKFGDLTNAVKENQGFFQSLWQGIKDFFSNLFS
ncbi:uncharacterized protein YpuA (DUF1002 family) [Enterococcus sp. PF1-24]|uniref:DUF1002 domain-containing protein n=1 Tax=unclassified Enterococcus TaxID=2608891 RepID=UPI002474865C|nr:MULTISPECIES: DUF1002 domain-containing protein [unclassified Enterococcus]MDH6364190.1 uncharacterized protein YpuA (DUF1002 family) [Enterococcus sp. PFB1-1]MDH6401291.1 uncharacterized protein YpuA (DUF1002 family) [Enterococcus sp. PF1-24]